MKRPTMSVVFTLNNRSEDCMEKVFSSFIGQTYDQMVVVLDRPEKGVAEFARAWWEAHHRAVQPEFVEMVGERGWLGPAKAWNAGFARVTSELTYLISSDVIQDPGNCEKAIAALSGPPLVVFGFCRDDGPIPLVTGPQPSVVCSSEIKRPLGFIWAMPTWILRMTGGFDEKFMDGYWYDDDDFTYRIWRLGIPYLFDDSIRGIHQHHDRATLDTPKGREMIQKNLAYIRSKWHSEHPWDIEEKGSIDGVGKSLVYQMVNHEDGDNWIAGLVGPERRGDTGVFGVSR